MEESAPPHVPLTSQPPPLSHGTSWYLARGQARLKWRTKFSRATSGRHTSTSMASRSIRAARWSRARLVVDCCCCCCRCCCCCSCSRSYSPAPRPPIPTPPQGKPIVFNLQYKSNDTTKRAVPKEFCEAVNNTIKKKLWFHRAFRERVQCVR